MRDLIEEKEKRQLKRWLYQRRNLVTDDPFFQTKCFCKFSKLGFYDLMMEAIEHGRKFDCGIENEMQLCHTIL